MDMKNIGYFLGFLGLAAIGMDFVGFVPSILAWIYNWGEAAAWGIKIALVVVWGALFFFWKDQEDDEDQNEDENKDSE